MKGVGYYDDRAYYPSSSNLSAFAQPFSVNKTMLNDVSAPYVDFAESADATPSNHFPVHSRPYGYDFFSSPVRELDSMPSSKLDPPTSQLPQFNTLGLASKDTFAYDQSSNNIKSSLLEAQPYYPSYISPSTHVINPAAPDHWSSLDDTQKKSEIGYSGQRVGFWNQFAEFNQVNSSPQVEAGGSFCSKEANLAGPIIEENLVNQGYQDVKASNSGKALHCINTMGWEKHGVGVPVSADQLDDKSCWWQTASSLPVNISSTSVQGSPLVSHDTHYDNHLKLVTDSGSYHSSYNASINQLLVQHDKPSLVDAGSSAPITGMKESYPLTCPRSTGCFDSGPIRVHLNRDDSTSANNEMLPDSHVATGVVDYIFKARNEFQNPQASLNNLCLGFRTDNDVNLNSFDTVDKCNPAVDSPCWKGAPATHFHSFDGSEALYPEHLKSDEEKFSLKFEGPQNFHLDVSNITEISYENSKNNQIDSETDYLEKGLAGSSRKFSVANFSSEKNNLDGAASTGCFESKPIYDYGLQYLDDSSEMTENIVPSNKSTYDSESRFSNEQQIMEEKMSQKQHTLSGAPADGEISGNEYLKYFASHAAELSPSLASSSVAAPTAQSAAEASTPKINIQILVDTMHNLSELLLFHCLNDTCKLKENDRSVLGNVISNLNTCASKNASQMFPVQECVLPHPNPPMHVGETLEVEQNARFERPHLTKVDPEGSKDHENLPVQEMKAHHFVSGKLGKFSDSFLEKVDTDMTKEDNMIKALKRTLAENFHDEEGSESQTLLYKNLWLEAEAAICSMKCRVRYNEMKTEMEKCSARRDVEEQSKLDDLNLSAAHSSAAKGNVVPNPDYSAENLPDLNAANLKELSFLKFSPDLNKPCTLSPDDNGGQNVDSFIQDSAVSGTSKETGGCEASTKATFYSCNYRDVNTCVNVANLKELLSSGACHAYDTADKLASGQTDNEDQANFTEISPNPGNNKADDYASSVMAGFHTLKSRDEGSCINSANIEEVPSSVVSCALDPADQSSYEPTHREIRATDFTQVNQDDDYVSSVMARFQVLKSRVEDSSSMSSEGQLLYGVESARNRTDFTITRDASEAHSPNFSPSPSIMHLSSYAAVEPPTPKEFHAYSEDGNEIQPQGTSRFGIQLPTYYSDGFSSEWEHVKMEEFTGQSSKP